MGIIENLKGKRDELVAGGVALSAFAASAQHIYHVTTAAGNPEIVAALHPAGIDGLIYIGIRAMQRGRGFWGKVPGMLTIGYGAGYSLAFNAYSYSTTETMPVWALAACMPLAMFFAFLIVHMGHKPAETLAQVVEVVKEVQVLPKLLPIVPFVAPQPLPAVPVAVAKASTRQAPWDVEKGVAMILAGSSNQEIVEVVGGVQDKTVQRVRRVVKALQAGMDPADIKADIKPPMSLASINRIHAAMQDMS